MSTSVEHPKQNSGAADVAYESDFCAWATHNAELLRARRFHELDVGNIAEELEGLARSERRELRNRLIQLLMHLLKWRYQSAGYELAPTRKSWRVSIGNQRNDIAELLAESPSLRPSLDEALVHAYQRARPRAADEAGLDIDTFPPECPWKLEEVLSGEFWPDE